ncbi:hypothetical protein LCGC14_0759420 [marine sediment metagenome]|uniref:Uncharacterized protein n=1 Tax=marine sediment metagenome TaxID=412755 RepID=A0A0F9T8Q0_9ZZZZ
MPSVKDSVIDFIKKLPDNLTVEEIAYKLYIDERINKAQQQMKDGNYLTHEEAKERLKKWLI